jgi:Flp pilus assembly protein TadG
VRLNLCRWRFGCKLYDRFGPGHVQHDHELPLLAVHLHVQQAIDGEAKVKFANVWRDERGTSALEFAMTAPVFFLFLFGVIETGLLFWTQIGLQHGAEMAARCATVNSILCPNNNPAAIASYATQQTFGLNLPATTFAYTSQLCGNQVNANYSFQLPHIFNMAPITLTAKACFPS